ncbi:hypothetical protein [Seleniivibrio woodruffii]|uniref:DUF5610 domain-containing protein n=1 Tax=Seleniivibrio woodruffii TaxID=1078050 RepID=A0A4R1KH23_9BACT|nr:hypothetical protein [Seleniivibrio woodruffii]TCK62669.1 hypothetical protein C8D98_1203 [Seleniivibrio woodruffii]TVZ36905.1 hypothetical protein OF66_2546 [Seleniivibrio woodruffii]
MYININVKSAELQYSAKQSGSNGSRTASNVSVNYDSIEIKTGNDQSAYSGRSALSPVEEHLYRSASNLMDIISRRTADNLKDQSFQYSASIRVLSVSIEISGEPTQDVAKKAEEMLGEDGYYGVEKTSDRLFELARKLSGNDIEKLKEAKDAITKGYESVKGLFGENTPDITHQTYDRTMEKMDGYIEYLNRQPEKSYA